MEENKRLEQGFDDPERQVIKNNIVHFTDAPEIQHFAMEKVNKNDNVYGITWGNLVKEYLNTAYLEEGLRAEVVSFGVTYKVLKRGEVTAFYDADGNTLFDVENKRLEKEYGYLRNEPDHKSENSEPITPIGKAIASIERQAFESAVSEPITESKNPEDVKERAKKKLEDELKKENDKTFAEPVIGYLLKRCEEDEGLAQDVIQNHKTWSKCFDYIYAQARKQTKGNRCAVRDEVVFEWAEDYYHKDDKTEKENKTQKTADRKKEDAKKKSDVKTQQKTVQDKNPDDKKNEATQKDVKKVDVPKKAPIIDKLKPKKNEMEGQLDMFSLMGM